MTTKAQSPHDASGQPVEINHRVQVFGRTEVGSVIDYETCPDGDVEVVWDHTDTASWWPASRLLINPSA
jgi:hypothetical protein